MEGEQMSIATTGHVTVTLTHLWERGACRNHPDSDVFFQSPPSREALRICATCPVKGPCGLLATLDRSVGCWGGLSDDERHQLWINRKDVSEQRGAA